MVVNLEDFGSDDVTALKGQSARATAGYTKSAAASSAKTCIVVKQSESRGAILFGPEIHRTKRGRRRLYARPAERNLSHG
jgi:hypothetical protein